MIFEPNKKIFINKDDYLEVLIGLMSLFFYPKDRWLQPYLLDFYKVVVESYACGVSLNSAEFSTWMEQRTKKSIRMIYNYKTKLVRKKWLIRTDHGVVLPKVITDFVDCIKKGDKALECRFLMDLCENKDIDELRMNTTEIHPYTQKRIDSILKKRKADKKLAENKLEPVNI